MGNQAVRYCIAGVEWEGATVHAARERFPGRDGMRVIPIGRGWSG